MPAFRKRIGSTALPLQADLIMQMRSGRAAGAAGRRDQHRPRSIVSPTIDQNRRQMGVARRDAVAVVDLDHVAVAARSCRRDDGAGRRRHDLACRSVRENRCRHAWPAVPRNGSRRLPKRLVMSLAGDGIVERQLLAWPADVFQPGKRDVERNEGVVEDFGRFRLDERAADRVVVFRRRLRASACGAFVRRP